MAKKTWIDAHENEQFGCGRINDQFPGCKGCIFAAEDFPHGIGPNKYGYNQTCCQKYPRKAFNEETGEFDDIKPEEYDSTWNKPCPYKQTK